MDFKTAEAKLREASKKGCLLLAVRPAWLHEAANQAAYCGAIEFESDYIFVEDIGESDGELEYTSDLIDTDETREATDFMLFDWPPECAWSADGKELCVSVDPVEGQELLNG